MRLISYFLLLLCGTFCTADLDYVKDLIFGDEDAPDNAYFGDYENKVNDDYNEDYIDDPGFHGSPNQRSCMRPCPRIYRPVCASVNGASQTLPSQCDFQNKVRCAQMENRRGKKRTRVRFLYNGVCRNGQRGPWGGPGVLNGTLPVVGGGVGGGGPGMGGGIGGGGPGMGSGGVSGIRSGSESRYGREGRNRLIDRLWHLINL